MVALDEAITWFAQPVTICTGTLPELRGQLPRFKRRPFGRNRFLDMIVRRPLEQGERPVPVATVSPQYELIQHREVLTWLAGALEAIGEDPDELTGRVTLSAYGERMELVINLRRSADFDPGDGYPLLLQARALNSVDKSTALEIQLAWLRQICSNGMTVGGDFSTRRIHLRGRNLASGTARLLREQLARADDDRELFTRWLETPVELDRIRRWADTFVAPAWGAHAAARLTHIVATGRDGRVEDRARRGAAAHELPVVEEDPVPGAMAPVDNAYHVSQALSWLASHRRTIQGRHERTGQIRRLMDALLTGRNA